MAKERAENYGARTVEVEEAVEFRDEKLEHSQDFRNDADSTWERNNQHIVKFTDELKTVNEQVALDFDHRKNPAQYDLEERRTMLDAVTDAFNAANWNGMSERRLAAESVAHSLFQPMYHRVEIAEAATQHQFPEQFIESLKQEQIEYLEQKIDDDGLPGEVLEFQVQDYETALRMVEESKGTFQIVSTSRLDHFRDRFADALYNNEEDENARAMMEHQLESAVAYYNGDLSRDDRFGRAVRRLISEQGEDWRPDNPGETNEKGEPEENLLENLWHRGNEVVEPDYRNMLSFSGLENMSAYEMDQEIREILNEELHHVQDYADQMKVQNHPDLNAVRQIQEALRDMTHDGIQGSVENGNGENFAAIMKNMKGTDEELASELRQNAGFIKAEDYEPPALPERFEAILEMSEYADRAEDALIDFRESISPLHHGIAMNLLEKLDNRLEALEGIQEDWKKANYNAGDPVPDGVTDPKVFHEDMQEAHKVAEALNYMLRPRNEELWGMWEKGNQAEDDARGNKWSVQFRELNMEHRDEALQGVNEQEQHMNRDPARHSENYANAIYAIGMIASRLDAQERYTTGIPEKEENGCTMADEFAMKYQPLLEESDRTAEYGLAVLNGTAHVSVDNPRRLGVEYDDTYGGIAMPEGGVDELVTEMEAYRQHYANMIGGTGGNNPEGDHDSMKILEYAVATYDAAVNGLRDVRDPMRGESFNTVEAAESHSVQQNLLNAARAAAVIDQIVTGRNEAD